MDLTFHPLTPDRWADLEAIFAAKGCSVARGCWFLAYREAGAEPPTTGTTTKAEARRRRMQAIVRKGPPPGLIAYRRDDGVPVGWVSFGAREDFKRLARSPVMKPIDDKPVWSVICFVVPREHRGQGVAAALLQAAAAHARAQGATLLEAYPVDKGGAQVQDDWLWFGTKGMYDRAGFVEVARRKPERPVVRLVLARGGRRG